MTLEDLAQALAAPGQPGVGLAALDAALASLVGHRLFTVLVLDESRTMNRRYHSSRPVEYPVGGYKPVQRGSDYFRRVVEAGEARFCHNREDIIRAFPDHALILSLGCESCVNVPIRWNGHTLGALNLLHTAGHYTAAQLPLLRVVAALAVAPLQWIQDGPES
jgi:transcriptional regulator with GAF, ATPase, and Fis domain